MATSAQIDQAILAYEYDLELNVLMDMSLERQDEPKGALPHHSFERYHCCSGSTIEGHRAWCDTNWE